MLASKTSIGIALLVTLLLLLTCFALLPAGLTSTDGLSYFGVHARSLPAYIAFLALYAMTLLRSSRLLAIKYATPAMRKLVWFMVFCIVMLAITPYTLSVTVHIIHDSFGISLFIAQLILVIWLTAKKRRGLDILLVCLLCLQFAAGIASLLSLTSYLPFEIPGQLVFQVVFVAILWRHLDNKDGVLADTTRDVSQTAVS
jgi:heme A synthase